MWSGGGWGAPGGGGGQPGWTGAQQAAFFQSMPTNQVDWAALAQQWIKMKEPGSEGSPPPGPPRLPAIATPPLPSMSTPPPPVKRMVAGFSQPGVPGVAPPLPNVPPPPDIGVPGEEGGEANMELEEEEAGSGWGGQASWGVTPAPAGGAVTSSEGAWQEQQQQQQWNESHNKVGYNYGEDYQGNGMEFYGRDGGDNWNVGRRDGPAIVPLMEVDTSAIGAAMGSTMSDAQRKKLPSWIREGLEKMEREKRKKEEDIEGSGGQRKRRGDKERKRLNCLRTQLLLSSIMTSARRRKKEKRKVRSGRGRVDSSQESPEMIGSIVTSGKNLISR